LDFESVDKNRNKEKLCGGRSTSDAIVRLFPKLLRGSRQCRNYSEKFTRDVDKRKKSGYNSVNLNA